MIFLLDSNAVSDLLRHHPAIRRKVYLARRTHCPLILSPVVEFEIRRGLRHLDLASVEKQFDRAARALRYSPFGRGTWLKAAELWAHSRRSGVVISDADVLIAAQAIELEAVLVTDNEKHFEVFKPLGLTVENWKQDVLNG